MHYTQIKHREAKKAHQTNSVLRDEWRAEHADEYQRGEDNWEYHLAMSQYENEIGWYESLTHLRECEDAMVKWVQEVISQDSRYTDQAEVFNYLFSRGMRSVTMRGKLIELATKFNPNL